MSPLMAWSEDMEIPCMAHLPPLKVTNRPFRHHECGTEFRPAERGVVRWEIEGRVLWVSNCPCGSTVTVHEAEVTDK